MKTDPWKDDDECNGYDEGEAPECLRCQGRGKVPTEDFESYFGADYKPCPVCGGDPCIGEPPCS